MTLELKEVLEAHRLPAEEIQLRARKIYTEMLTRSRHLRVGNFTAIDTDDLRRGFELYDQAFFAGSLMRQLDATPLAFRLSKRMTKAAGKVTRRQMSNRGESRAYEITVSTTLLFQTFRGENRPILLSGIHCRDRLEALQRVLEHEIVHLAEWLTWDDTSCSASRFQSIAGHLFGHTEHRHQLITPYEHAQIQYGIRPGDRVTFQFEERSYTGIVNRITRRATILVEDPRGESYTDGKRYRKFYVPLSLLRKAQPTS